MIFLYLYMIRARNKYYAKQSAPAVKVEQTEKVPEKKTQWEWFINGIIKLSAII